ncbi:hypothetical protein FRC00_008842 [Tulasnella sp. 408]|nr:hypothetical protein FRC00_008842 [Tulasnella sp. 408]
MAKDASEKKSKKEKRKSDVATLAVDDVLIEKQHDIDGDVVMEASVVEVVSKEKKKKDKSSKLVVPVEQVIIPSIARPQRALQIDSAIITSYHL